MKPQEQIKALAELDGLKERLEHEHYWTLHGTVTFTSIIPNYLTSYDAIIPVAIRFLDAIIITKDTTQATICEQVLRKTGRWT